MIPHRTTPRLQVDLRRLFNYLKRQIFVVTSTWASPHQRYLAYGAQAGTARAFARSSKM